MSSVQLNHLDRQGSAPSFCVNPEVGLKRTLFILSQEKKKIDKIILVNNDRDTQRKTRHNKDRMKYTVLSNMQI